MEDIPSQSLFSLLFSLESLVYLIILFILVVLSGMISGAEVAFFSLSPSNKDELKKSESQVTKTALELIKKPKELLATILIINNLINIGIIIFSNYLIDYVYQVNFSSTFSKFAIKILAIGFLIMLFGEILPKVYASKHNIRFVKFLAIPLKRMKKLLAIVTSLLIRLTKNTEKRLSKKANQSPISIDEFSQAIELTSKSFNEKEKNIIISLAHFGKKTVAHVMQPRVDIFGIEKSVNFKTIKKEIFKSSFSRIPIYENSLDKIIGILYLKDLLPYVEEKDDFNWISLIKKVFYVPEYKKLDDLLRDFQEKKVHFAVVADEYGGTEGIVTLEDLLEEIIGDINDEFDQEETSYKVINDNTFIFDAKTPIPEMCRIMKINQEEMIAEIKGKDVTSIAGLIIEVEGKILKKNEKVILNNLVFEVDSADRRRIKKVKVSNKTHEL